MFRASLCPSSGEQEQDWLKLHVRMPGCAGCGCVEPWCRQCAPFESCCSTWLTWVEEHEHSGHTSTDYNDENVETLRTIINKAQCSILEFIGSLSFPYGTCL
jgi:hypothetical protein